MGGGEFGSAVSELHQIPAQEAVIEIQGAAWREGGYKHKESPPGLQSLERYGERPEGSVVVGIVGDEADETSRRGPQMYRMHSRLQNEFPLARCAGVPFSTTVTG